MNHLSSLRLHPPYLPGCWILESQMLISSCHVHLFLSNSCHSGGMIDNEKVQIGGGQTVGGYSEQQAFLGGGGGGGGGGVAGD